MSAITATLAADGTLTIAGNEGNDRVFVRTVAGKVAASVQSNQGPRRPLGSFDAAKVKAIAVDLGAGANLYDGYGVGIPAAVKNAFDVSNPAPGGMLARDVNQRMSADCVLEACAVGALAVGIRPAVAYAGPTATGAKFRVTLAGRSDVVEFNGTLGGDDPFIHPSRPGAFWYALLHRMARRMFPGSVQGPWGITYFRGGNPMGIDQLNVTNISPVPGEEQATYDKVAHALASGKIVILETFDAPPLPGQPAPPYRTKIVDEYLVNSHAYTVIAVTGGNVTLRNPWGLDKDEHHFTGAQDDGIITRPWGPVCNSAANIHIG